MVLGQTLENLTYAELAARLIDIQRTIDYWTNMVRIGGPFSVGYQEKVREYTNSKNLIVARMQFLQSQGQGVVIPTTTSQQQPQTPGPETDTGLADSILQYLSDNAIIVGIAALIGVYFLTKHKSI